MNGVFDSKESVRTLESSALWNSPVVCCEMPHCSDQPQDCDDYCHLSAQESARISDSSPPSLFLSCRDEPLQSTHSSCHCSSTSSSTQTDSCADCELAEKEHLFAERSLLSSGCSSPQTITSFTQNHCNLSYHDHVLQNMLKSRFHQPKISSSRDEALENQRKKQRLLEAQSHTEAPSSGVNVRSLPKRQNHLRAHMNDINHSARDITDWHDQDFENSLLYCHWGDQCEEMPFHNEVEFDRHLKSTHFGVKNEDFNQQQTEFSSLIDDGILDCHWDSCTQSASEFSELLDHIKKNHLNSSAHHPHANCIRVKPELSPAESSDTNNVAGQVLKCRWEDCGFYADNTSILDTHLLKDHMNPPIGQTSYVGLPSPAHDDVNWPQMAKESGVTMFQCEWKACNYQSGDFEQFLSHVRKDHVAALFFGIPSSTCSPSIKENLIFEEGSLASSEHQHHLHSHDHQHIHSHENQHHIHAHEHDAGHSHQIMHEVKHICQWDDGGTICGKVLTSPEELSKHVIDDHVGCRKTEYVCRWKGCERCLRPFQQRQKIIRHLQTHSKSRPFVCEVCGSRFAEEAVLKQHSRVHSGEKPFECKICGKKFAASTALSVHLRIHTGEKPLKCKWPGCGKCFSESSNLAKHMKGM